MPLQGLNGEYYFTGIAKVTRGPWWREHLIDDDGSDWFYKFVDNEGKVNYLLTNNIPIRHRDHLYSLFKTNKRVE